MSSLRWKSLGVRESGGEWATVASIAAAVFIVGVSYGALAIEANLPAWLVVALAVTTLGASAELLFVSVILSGASPVIAACGALLVNLRNGIYGIATAKFLPGGWRQFVGAHLVNDETVGYAATKLTATDQRYAFWRLGLAILVAWPLGATIGVIIGHAIADTSVLGLDAVFPSILIAMLFGSTRDRLSFATVACGALIAIAATPFAAAGVTPVIALASLALPLTLRRRRG